MRRYALFLLLIGAVFAAAGCSSGPMAPVPTPIPLAVTATASPRPPRPTATPMLDRTATAPAPAATTPVSGTPMVNIQVDDALAQRTATGFLTRLVRGDIASAVDLYLTDGAVQEGLLQRTAQSSSASTLLDAELVELRRTSTSSFEAHALLHWAGSEDGSTGTQPLTLYLTEQRGLWLIDDLSLGDLQISAPTPKSSAESRTGATGKPSRPSELDGKLAFQVGTGGDIYTINADGTALRRLTDGMDPMWSPDGTQLVLSRWREPRGVWVVGTDGSEQRLFDWSETRSPVWSPDGDEVAFVRQLGGRLEETERCFWKWCFAIPPYPHWKLGILSAKDGTLTEPPSAEVSQAPAWSPDGARIVYHDDQGLAWLDLAGDGIKSGRFATSRGWDTSPAFSPDGSQIVFVGKAHTNWELFIMDADGSGRRQLTFSGTKDTEPRHSVAPDWSPDGQNIAFLSNRDGLWRIYVMTATGSSQRLLFGDKLDHLGIRFEFASERVLSWSQ